MKLLLTAILLVSASRIAAGCSYDLRDYNSVEKRFAASRIVALAEVVSSSREKFDYQNGGSGNREVVEFRLLEVFKGQIEPGMKVVTATDVNNSCGLNVLNSPPILEDVNGRIYLGKLWVLYLDGDPPYVLSQTPGSQPLLAIASDLPALYRLAHMLGVTRAKPNKSLERTRGR